MKSLEDFLLCTVKIVEKTLPTVAIVGGLPLGNLMAKEVIRYNVPEKLNFAAVVGAYVAGMAISLTVGFAPFYIINNTIEDYQTRTE